MAIGGICIMVLSGHVIKLLGIIENLWYLMMASCGPWHATKSASQTSVVSFINRPFLQNLNYRGRIKSNYITHQISITLSIAITGRVLTSENLICATSGGGAR
jgi:hypothetical protein